MARELKTRLEAEQFFQAFPPQRKDECLFQEARRIVIAEVFFIFHETFNQIFHSVPEYCLQRISTCDYWSKNDARKEPTDWHQSDKVQPTTGPESQQRVCNGN